MSVSVKGQDVKVEAVLSSCEGAFFESPPLWCILYLRAVYLRGSKIFSCVNMMLNLKCSVSKTQERSLKAAKVRNDCNDSFPSVCDQSRCWHHPPQRARGRLRLGQKHPQNSWSPGPESSRRSAGESPSSRSWFCCRQFVWKFLQKVQICYLCN